MSGCGIRSSHSQPKTVIDTDRPIEDCVDKAAKELALIYPRGL